MKRACDHRRIMEAANERGLMWRGQRVRVVGAKLPFAHVYTDTADSSTAQFAGQYEWQVIARVTSESGRLEPPASS